jgi:hypothetical protein
MLISGYEFWSLKATHGIPLELLMEELFSKNIYPKWDEVLLAAKADGANLNVFVSQLKIHFEEVCSKESVEHMMLSIDKLYKRMVDE